MTVTILSDPETARLRKRLRELTALQRQVADEINLTRDRLAETGRQRRRRGVRPPCGTDAGYEWHRYHEPDNWPLPAEDPCGCKAARAAKNRVKDSMRRVEEVA